MQATVFANAITVVEIGERIAFGDGGPMAGCACSDLQIQALSGMLDTTAMPDADPVPERYAWLSRRACSQSVSLADR